MLNIRGTFRRARVFTYISGKCGVLFIYFKGKQVFVCIVLHACDSKYMDSIMDQGWTIDVDNEKL